MKKIIVPVDFSDHSKHALDFAIELNENIKGRITLLHVLEMPSYGVNYGADMTVATAQVVFKRELIDGVSDQLHEWSEKVKAAGQEVAIRTDFGNVFKGIGKEIAEEKADLVVLGSKGASGLVEIFVGSNAERVIRYSECPVITLKGPTRLSDVKSLVFPTDTRSDQNDITQEIKKFQELLGLNMHMLRVLTPHNFLSKSDAVEELDAFAEGHGIKNFTTNTIEADMVEDGILNFAQQIGAGLIAMGTHGRTGVAHLLTGSRAEDVANHAKVPLLTVKIDDFKL